MCGRSSVVTTQSCGRKPVSEHHALRPAVGRGHVAHRGVSEHLSPALADRRAERVRERLVPAADPAHHLAAGASRVAAERRVRDHR